MQCAALRVLLEVIGSTCETSLSQKMGNKERFARFSYNLIQIGSDASRSSHRTWVGDFGLS